MKTVDEILKQADELGARCTERTFWKYHKLGLLPEGLKITGRGNVLYFPNDTALRLLIIQLLTKEMQLSLSDISRYPWAQVEPTQLKSPREWRPSDDFILEAKSRFDRAKDTMVREVIEKLLKDLTSGTSVRKNPNRWR